MQANLEQGLIDCVSRGLSKDKIVKQIEKQVGVDRYMADRLARTELTFVQNEAAARAYEKAGITHYQFITAKDGRVSKECKALDNRIFAFGEKRVGKNFPPIHANCRCTIVPVIADGEKKPLGKGLEGQQTGHTEKIGKINPEETKIKIQEYSELIRDKDIEHAYIIDRFGNVFYSVGGNR